jgi:hypothetical protein
LNKRKHSIDKKGGNAFLTGVEMAESPRFSYLKDLGLSLDKLPDGIRETLMNLPSSGISTDGKTFSRYNYVHPNRST